ncbi:hypothetical protein WM00_08915 [Burkholderia cepacia]|nr:hypothetical protein WM00_08915 [Burkholderia cepacia]
MPTQQQIADHFDLDQSAVSRFVDKVGLDYRAVSIDEIRIAYIRHLCEVAAGRSSLHQQIQSIAVGKFGSLVACLRLSDLDVGKWHGRKGGIVSGWSN